jgi:hypothetical protein
LNVTAGQTVNLVEGGDSLVSNIYAMVSGDVKLEKEVSRWRYGFGGLWLR